MNGSVRVAAVGDLHCKGSSPGSFQTLFSRIAESADVLALCGDLTDRGLADEARILAKELQAVKIPKVAVLGNHDYESDAAGEGSVRPAGAPAAIAPAGPTDPRKLAGVCASPGLALGKVAQVRRTAVSVEKQGLGVERERAHLDAALERARQQISGQQSANSGAASRILDAHLDRKSVV